MRHRGADPKQPWLQGAILTERKKPIKDDVNQHAAMSSSSFPTGLVQTCWPWRGTRRMVGVDAPASRSWQRHRVDVSVLHGGTPNQIEFTRF